MTDPNEPETDKEMPARPPRNWASLQDQIKGKDIFVAKLKENSTEQDACHSDSAHAKKMFARWGAFYIEGEVDPEAYLPPYDSAAGATPIPKATEFRVYRNGQDLDERNKTVVIVLPPVTPEEIKEDLAQVREWSCTYTPYQD